MAKLYRDSTGVYIELDTQLDVATLAAATGVLIRVQRPDASTTLWGASVVSGTSKIRHAIVTGDLPSAGTFKLQAGIVFAGGSNHTTFGDTVSLQVFDPFK